MNKKKIGSFVLGIIIVAVFCVGGWLLYDKVFTEKTHVEYIQQSASGGNLELTIAATGTVEPEELVNVGAQVGGMILTLGTDADGKTIDYGSRVKAGMVLARIDDALYQTELQSAQAQRQQAEAQLEQARAQLLQAQAQKKSAEAGVRQANAKVSEAEAGVDKMNVARQKAESAWAREQKLHQGNASTDSAYEEAGAAYYAAKKEAEAAAAGLKSAKANLEAAESALQTAEAQISAANAQILAAKAQISAADAALSRVKRNLEYCVIKSPVDGVIIDRRVNVGQTVNSSMSAPSLFLIAKDLKKMQVWVSVNEADIGQIKPGQRATFTVDTFPGRVFEGSVGKIRLNATMSQNVVTYVVEITTDNSDLTLLPYLTANVNFVLDSRVNALAVPNSALRFRPQDISQPAVKPGERVVWTLGADGKPQPVVVRTGLNNGMMTEITDVVSGKLDENTQVITGSRIVSDAQDDQVSGGENPFMAKPPARSGGGKRR